MFKPTDKKVAEELKSTLSENGLHAYVSQGKDSKVAVYVNLKK